MSEWMTRIERIREEIQHGREQGGKFSDDTERIKAATWAEADAVKDAMEDRLRKWPEIADGEMLPLRLILLAEQERDRADDEQKERERLTDVLLSRHGGEPLTLLDELDESRAENERLRSLLAWALGFIGPVDEDHEDLIAAIEKEVGDE